MKEYASPRAPREELSTYLRFYNEERVHQSRDYDNLAMSTLEDEKVGYTLATLVLVS
jgi:hypothetical protein